VDLFVRVSNKVAVKMYEKLGYVIYRQIIDYYSGDQPEDAFDMRKSLSTDVNKHAMIPLKNPVHANQLDDD
jgi:N-terminal acetyltransferase B complex catalytic subunit